MFGAEFKWSTALVQLPSCVVKELMVYGMAKPKTVETFKLLQLKVVELLRPAAYSAAAYEHICFYGPFSAWYYLKEDLDQHRRARYVSGAYWTRWWLVPAVAGFTLALGAMVGTVFAVKKTAAVVKHAIAPPLPKPWWHISFKGVPPFRRL